MSALENLAQSDASVSDFYKKVMSSMGQTPKVETTAAEPQKPVKDTRLDLIVEKYATATIKDVLAPLKLHDRYQKLIQNHVLQHAKDLASLDAEGVKTLARQFITNSGFTVEEMRQVRETPVKSNRPVTGRQNGAAPGVPAKSGAKSAAAAPKFKNREEYLNHRAGVVEDLISELIGS